MNIVTVLKMVGRLRIMNKNPRWGIFLLVHTLEVIFANFFLLLTIPLSHGGISATQWIPAVAGMTKVFVFGFFVGDGLFLDG